MFVVLGVTGNTGSVVAKRLLETGRKVRVVVRSADKGRAWAERGAEVAVASIEEPQRLQESLEGAEGAYVLSPPDLRSNDFLGERRKVMEGVAQAVRAARPSHVVLLSSVGAQYPSGTGPIVSVHHAERALADTGVPCTAVRASYFLENWGVVVPAAKNDGVLPTFIRHDRPTPMVATADIGEVAARALLDGPRGRRVLELAGPRDYTPDDVAAALSARLRRPVRALDLPLDAVVPTFTSFGISANLAALYREMYEALAANKLGWELGPSELVRGEVGLDEFFARVE